MISFCEEVAMIRNTEIITYKLNPLVSVIENWSISHVVDNNTHYFCTLASSRNSL